MPGRQTEDDDYLVSGAVDEFAIAEPDPEQEELDEFDSEQVVNARTIQDILEYCDKEIAVSNTFDVLNIPQNATDEQKIAVFDEMAIHKGVVMHLRNIKAIITDKAREI